MTRGAWTSGADAQAGRIMARRSGCTSCSKAPPRMVQARRAARATPDTDATLIGSKNLPRHQREHAPAQVFTRVRGIAFGFRGQFGSYIWREVVVGIHFEPSAHGEPLGRLVPVPAVLICQNHFHDVVVEVAEVREKSWKREKFGGRSGKASFGNVFRRRQLPPVRLADEDDPSGAEALRQEFDGAGDSPTDPGGT